MVHDRLTSRYPVISATAPDGSAATATSATARSTAGRASATLLCARTVDAPWRAAHTPRTASRAAQTVVTAISSRRRGIVTCAMVTRRRYRKGNGPPLVRGGPFNDPGEDPWSIL